MNKFTAASLIGAASAAPGPAVVSTWPVFTTTADIAGTDNLSGEYALAFYSQQSAASPLTATVGPCRALRSDHFIALTQAISAVSGSGSTAATGAVTDHVTGSSNRAFWQTVLANIGTYAPKLATTVAVNATAASYWAVCKTVGTAQSCNSYVNYVNTSQTVISNRLVYKKSAATASVYISSTSGTGNFVQFNNDLLMASLYHEADLASATTATTDGSKWCSAWDTKVTKDGNAVTVTAMYGLTGRSKCTWFLTAEDNTVGPSFKVLPSEQFDFDMQWFEFAGQDALESSALLPATSTANFFLGNYGANTNGAVSLNPLKAALNPVDSSFVANGILRWADYTDPALYPGGSIGDVQYFPGLDGDQKDSQQLTMNQYNIASMYSQINGVYSAYNSAVAAYNPLREAYDSALDAETARLADALKAAFDPMITIPERPCAPMQPVEYSGVYLDLAKANASSGNTQPTTATAAGKMGWLVRTLATSNASNNTSSVKATIASGFVYLNKDTVKTPALQLKAGHVFGRLGQNDMTIPEGDKPFIWASLAATQKAAMMLSIFPTTDASTGVATSKTFSVEFKGMAWAATSDFNKPGRPGAVANPKSSGATMLSLGVASAVVISTLA